MYQHLWAPLNSTVGRLFTCGGNPLRLLSMLIEFLCSLIKRIEFASAVGCYIASWIRTHPHKRAQKLASVHSRTAMHTPIHPSWQLVNCQGGNWKWWFNCIRVLIYPGLLFIYLAVDFKAALIVWVRQDKVRIDRLDVKSRLGPDKLVDRLVRLCKKKLPALYTRALHTGGRVFKAWKRR